MAAAADWWEDAFAMVWTGVVEVERGQGSNVVYEVSLYCRRCSLMYREYLLQLTLAFRERGRDDRHRGQLSAAS